MYFRSVYDPVRCHTLRAAYCFARYLDDVLDGDISIDGPPKEYVCRLMHQIKNGESSDSVSTYVMLGKYVYQQIDKYASNGTLPSYELDNLIEAMIFDCERADRQLLLTQKELDRHHTKTFTSALHVTLDITGARYKSYEIEPLARAQASLYTLRDLEKDLEASINNIPKHILNQIEIDKSCYWIHSELIQTDVLRDWIHDEFNRGVRQLNRMRRLLENKNDFRFNATVKPLYRGLTHLTGKLRRRYDVLL